MNLQTALALLAALAAAAHLLRGPLASLFGRSACASGGCAGCSAACPARRSVPRPGKP